MVGDTDHSAIYTVTTEVYCASVKKAAPHLRTADQEVICADPEWELWMGTTMSFGFCALYMWLFAEN